MSKPIPRTPAPANIGPPPGVVRTVGRAVWRDGNLLVLHFRLYQFPSICLKGGRATDLVEFEHTQFFVPRTMAWFMTIGTIWWLLFRYHSGEKIVLRLPVEKSWLIRHRATNWLNHPLILVAIALFLVIGGAYVFIRYNNADVGMWTGMLAFFAGAAMLLVCSYRMVYDPTNPFPVRQSQGSFLWIGGIDAEVLEHFPVFPGVVPAEHEARAIDLRIRQQAQVSGVPANLAIDIRPIEDRPGFDDDELSEGTSHQPWGIVSLIAGLIGLALVCWVILAKRGDDESGGVPIPMLFAGVSFFVTLIFAMRGIQSGQKAFSFAGVAAVVIAVGLWIFSNLGM